MSTVACLIAALLLACGSDTAAPPSPPAAALATKRCVACHEAGPAGAHAAVPCAACHLGDPAGETADAAHAGLEREPGALDTADRTCGACHPEELRRVRTVPMTTNRGLVGVDRFVFGELPTPDTEATMADVLASPSPSPAEDHLRRLCGGCHLGTRRTNRDDAVTGASGCAACHAGLGAPGHPTVDNHVSDDRCAGCHSRSARIALTYAGRVEGPCGETLPDGRTVCATTPDVHAAAGLACVDCHVHTELMGDGTSRAHQEQQLEVRCATCHVQGDATPVAVVDPVTTRLPAADGSAVGDRGTPLWNVRADGTLVGKLDGAVHPIPTVEAGHVDTAHQRLTCSACHAAVAPTCDGCHTTYDPTGEQWDFGAGVVKPGAWRESGPPEALLPPALGVDAADRIKPAVPGMVGTVAGRSVRHFALVEPHATRNSARTCADCHTNAAVLGLGAGALDLTTLRFTPVVPSAGTAGGAPWTTLGAASPGVGTRVGARSLDAEEQRRVLRVGVCLGCHRPADLLRFGDLQRRPAECTAGPGWWDLR